MYGKLKEQLAADGPVEISIRETLLGDMGHGTGQSEGRGWR